jgi:hypothetical protein
MSKIRLKEDTSANVGNPPTGYTHIFQDSSDGALKVRKSNGSVVQIENVIGVDNDTVTSTFGRDSATTTNIWLYGADGIAGNLSPFVIPYNATIVAMSAACNGNETFDAEVYINSVVRAGGTPSDASKIAELVVNNTQSAFNNSLSVNVNAGDEIAVFLRGSNVARPTVTLFMVRR